MSPRPMMATRMSLPSQFTAAILAANGTQVNQPVAAGKC
jgi:hypothetical protein